ncbi:Gfo/Idh/MocA family oxidoreductase [Maribacter litopenaei]|uniref:Gfo/Idh/MocA family oxidoreductase n=1 Tax=Maribacter litopenaei TaxID=2976127 RepID=A0ABY5Y4Q9_9FLAO|nr:Gfo/Idh/MocA family oxidoreductase [Maribacter litopenaei]UWX53995.1 Gfo/Idh/MocA family oxidoreductase [Maribacter litopenaei]
MKTILTLIGILTLSITSFSQEKPLKLGIAGLTHGHVGWILGREHQPDINMVGIFEQNKELAQRLSKQYGFSMDIVYDSMEELIKATKPDAVAAFGNIKDHLSVVETCAPKGIHVMVEKPLAVSLEDAKKMEALAKNHGIHLLTNYETSWYETNVKAKNLLDEGKIGGLRKAIIRDGHKDPKKLVFPKSS